MKRVPIAPPTKFAKAMKSAQESGEKLIADGITLTHKLHKVVFFLDPKESLNLVIKRH